MITQVSGANLLQTAYNIQDNNRALFLCLNEIFMYACECAYVSTANTNDAFSECFVSTSSWINTCSSVFPQICLFLCVSSRMWTKDWVSGERVLGRGEGDDG